MSTQVINNYLYLMSMSDLAALQDISPNIDPKRMNARIKEAQDLDLSLFMGDSFWYDLLNQFDLTGFLTAAITIAATTATDGTYINQAVTGGSGTGAFATFVVLSGKVTSVTQTSPGVGYAVGDNLTCAATPGASYSISGLCGVLKSGTSQLYQDFFNGAIYKDLSGNNVKYDGIIPALVYWTFARFIEDDQVRYTTTGPVGKNHDQADNATPKQIAALVEMARSKANAYCNKIEKFLYIHKASFPLWRISQQNKNSRQPGARIRAIDRTKYNRGSYGSYGYGLDDFGGII
jgi:hypothetical protein